jgi:hypothetical protein
MTRELTLAAAHNNAVWCDTVCASQGRAGEFHDSIWVNRYQTPTFYPNAVTLADKSASSAQIEHIRTLFDAGIPGEWAVKDSFYALDLASLGFRVLFEASWIARPSTLRRPDRGMPGIRWAIVQGATELMNWEMAWRGTPDTEAPVPPPIFLPALLADDAVVILAAYRENQIVGGAIANRTGDVVGLSNVFTRANDEAPDWAGGVGAAIDAFPGLAVVGYEAGDDLDEARAVGFDVLHPLRIWACTPVST